MQEIRLWTIAKDDQGDLTAEPVDTTDHTETEKQLEDLLVKSPELLLPGLRLVGRQTPAASGALDLLGVSEDGNLIVFELKRGILTRDAVAQVIDYASYLAGLETEELITHVSQRSGTGGIEKIEDFRNWYEREFPNNPDGYIGRPSMALVGLGADDRTRRMVDFLLTGGLDISIITFHAFKKADTIFLAKQIESKAPATPAGGQVRYTKADNLVALRELSERVGVSKLFESLAEFFRNRLNGYEWPSLSGYSYSLIEQTEKGTPSYRVYVSIYISEAKKGQVQLVFQQRALQAAQEKIEKLLIDHPNRFVKSHGNLQTWVRSESDWASLSSSIESLIPAIIKGWQGKTREQNPQILFEESK
jgi:hypothetical protein